MRHFTKIKATQQSNETEANPNSKKIIRDYEQKQTQNLSDANTIAVKKDQPKVVVDSMQPQKQEDTPEEQADKPYKDGLKKDMMTSKTL